MKQISVSEDFKKMTIKAVGAILLFIITYFVLICFAITLTLLCGLAGYALVSSGFHGYTVMLAIGLVSMGILILIFLVKFIFKKHKTDLTHLTEITRDQEPQLFLMIEEIVKEVDTDFPKKIYLSADVNAAVFYDSSFWSMFLPVRKNLQIGLGLINTVSVIELRAILAHEFGHFSQRTMKVGSYVYNTNQVIYNMLYDNESYDNMAQKWAEKSTYFAIFVAIAVKIIRGFQWILQKVYNIVNLSYMSLSREMEFHADEVAANVTGSRPLITSLLRMDLADQSYQAVLQHYQRKVSDLEMTNNIYPQQAFVMNFLAEKSQLPIENNLPQVSLAHLNRYNKSKLVITNQWASHPSTEDRVKQLERLNLKTLQNDTKPASEIFRNIEVLESKLTEKIFSPEEYNSPATIQSKEQFIHDFIKEHQKNSFSEIYNSYFNSKNPTPIDLLSNEEVKHELVPALGDLFGNDIVEYVYEFTSLESDINLIRQISEGNYSIKSFDYDGTKYTLSECQELIERLEKKSQEMRLTISRNDKYIYNYFLKLADNQGSHEELNSLYRTFFQIDAALDNRFQVYGKMVNATNFMFQTTAFETIKENLKIVQEVEVEFKKDVRSMLEEDIFQHNLTDEIRAILKSYSDGNYTYFYDQTYKSDEVEVLFSVISNYQSALLESHFDAKKRLMDFQASLIVM